MKKKPVTAILLLTFSDGTTGTSLFYDVPSKENIETALARTVFEVGEHPCSMKKVTVASWQRLPGNDFSRETVKRLWREHARKGTITGKPRSELPTGRK